MQITQARQASYNGFEVMPLNNVVFYALFATLGTWAVTALGAALVIFFKRTNETLMNLLLGFAAGVMIAASFWSLLRPAVERAELHLQTPAWLVVTAGFLGGALFLWGSDKIVGLARGRVCEGAGGTRGNRVMMLVLSITLHNIPEGLAVGVAFGALHGGAADPQALMGAVVIAVGIGLQNFPEGAAVSLPLRREGYSRGKSFLMGQASGMVEPIAGVLGAVLVIHMQKILPFALAFAAGAMILVAVHELIPECRRNQEANPYVATMGVIAGFAVMMLMDTAL